MPTYDYVCDLCAHAFEYFQSMTEPLLTECPSCRKRGLRRLIGSGAGVLFKGSGFYETDYKRAPTAAKGGKDGKDPATKAGAPAAPQGDASGTETPATDKSAAPSSGSPKPDTPASTKGDSKPGAPSDPGRGSSGSPGGGRSRGPARGDKSA